MMQSQNFVSIPFSRFMFDYTEDGSKSGIEEATTGRRRKKPWRYRWPDEVPARILNLNVERGHGRRNRPTGWLREI